MNITPWLAQAERLHQEPGFTYEHLAKDLVHQLTWTGAVDVATALRAHVYGTPGAHSLHTTVKPLYDRLGWEQAALITSWFRNLNNKPQRRPLNVAPRRSVSLAHARVQNPPERHPQ